MLTVVMFLTVRKVFRPFVKNILKRLFCTVTLGIITKSDQAFMNYRILYKPMRVTVLILALLVMNYRPNCRVSSSHATSAEIDEEVDCSYHSIDAVIEEYVDTATISECAK